MCSQPSCPPTPASHRQWFFVSCNAEVQVGSLALGMFGFRVSTDVITTHFSLSLFFCSPPNVSFVLRWPQSLSQIQALQERINLIQSLKSKPPAYLQLGQIGLT